MTVAAVIMGVIVWLLSSGVERIIPVEELTGQIAAVLIPVTGGAIAYLGLLRVFHIQELDHVRGLVARRRSR